MNLKCKKDSNLQECMNMVAHVWEHKHDALDSKPALDFSINLSESWLEDICRKKSDPKEAALQVLAVRFKKLIETFKLLNFEIPKIGDIEGLDVYLRSIGIVHTSKSLTQIVNLKNQIINSYVENTLLEPTPLPNFDRLTLDANKKVSGGSQEKSIGTGFYTNNITSELFFVKRTTRLHLLADDISETLSSEICNILKFTQFAQCLPIYSKTTRDIYIASKCEEGFNPIFNMDGRLTSRLLPGERKEFIQKLDQGSKDQLLNILFMSNLIGDYDPNPGNIGTTTNRGIIKIDHGWAFDQVLSDFMPTWHNTLNPLRYPARFAPTNALCDYNFLLHNAKTDFFQHLFVRFQKPDSLQESLLAIFHNIAKIYEGTRASGSLKDKIEKQDIIALLCERFGLPHTDEVTFELLSEKLNAALYTRFHNLYLITLLDKIKHTKHIANTVSEHNELKKQLGFMLECNVPYNNLGLIKKLSTEIKETHNNRELHKTIECILNRTQLMNNASSSSLPQMTRSKPAPSIIQKFNMLENKDEAKEETVFRVPDMPPRNRTQLMNNASSSSLPQMVRSKPALSIIPKFNTLESKGEAKEETVFRVPDIPSRNKKRGVRTNTSPPRKKQRK